MPDERPDITPKGETLATPEPEMLQTPPDVASVAVTVAKGQSERVPPIAAGAGGTVFTVTGLIIKLLPQELVTV